jgi:hypothetical protein
MFGQGRHGCSLPVRSTDACEPVCRHTFLRTYMRTRTWPRQETDLESSALEIEKSTLNLKLGRLNDHLFARS